LCHINLCACADTVTDRATSPIGWPAWQVRGHVIDEPRFQLAPQTGMSPDRRLNIGRGQLTFAHDAAVAY